MSATISIRPSKDLRNNYSKISLMCKKNPVAITVNGKEDTVLLSHNSFVDRENYISELEAKLMVYDHLAQAVDDIKLGRVQDINDAFDDIIKEVEAV